MCHLPCSSHLLRLLLIAVVVRKVSKISLGESSRSSLVVFVHSQTGHTVWCCNSCSELPRLAFQARFRLRARCGSCGMPGEVETCIKLVPLCTHQSSGPRASEHGHCTFRNVNPGNHHACSSQRDLLSSLARTRALARKPGCADRPVLGLSHEGLRISVVSWVLSAISRHSDCSWQLDEKHEP